MHHFVNFKGFTDAKVELMRPLTVLIGPNGSGKSNIIEGVELLSFIAQGRPLHEVEEFGRGRAKHFQIRGGLHGCPTFGSDSFSLGYTAKNRLGDSPKLFTYLVEIIVKPRPRIGNESLMCEDGLVIFNSPYPDEAFTSAKRTLWFNDFAGDYGGREVPAPADRSFLSLYLDHVGKDAGEELTEASSFVIGIRNHLELSFTFDPDPKAMRSYSRMGATQLERNGANISAVLFGLKNGTPLQRESLQRILDWIKQLPEEPFQGIDFVEVHELQDVMLRLVAKGGRRIDARILSDGTLRTLALLTALETCRRRVIVMEEFDNGLHPSRVRVLIEALESCCRRYRHKVLLTTHNPATLDALSPKQLEGVVMCVHSPEKDSLDLVRLAELSRYPEILERGRLGDLVTRRVVDQYLRPGFEEERKDEALKWLDSLG